MTNENHLETIDHEIPLAPKLLRGLLAIVAIAIGLSTLPWIFFAASGKFGGFEWAMFGYEITVLAGAVFAILLAKGWYRSGWALGVIAIAGSWLVALLFGFFIAYIKAKRADFPDVRTLGDITFFGRIGGIGALTLIASLAVFSRRAKSFKFAIFALIWASPMIIAGVLVALDTGPGRWLSGIFVSSPSSNGGAAAVSLMGVGLVAIALVSISGHLLIRAFELGAVDRKDS